MTESVSSHKVDHAITSGLIAGTLAQAINHAEGPFSGYNLTLTGDGEGNYTRYIEVTSPRGCSYTIAIFEEYCIQEVLNPGT